MAEVQHQRIDELCGELKLEAMADVYPQLAAKAVANQLSFADFLESLLKTEVATRQGRSRQLLAKMAGFPAIKTLEQFDFTAAQGASKKTLQELLGLALLERAENLVLLGPSDYATSCTPRHVIEIPGPFAEGRLLAAV